MSWNFEIRGDNKEQVVGECFAEAERYSTYCPVARVMELVLGAVEGMPENSVKKIRTQGHIYEDGSGSISVAVNL